MPWAFDLQLDPDADARNAADRGPHPVPQLRYGGTLVARSRNPDDVLIALARVLGGVATVGDERRWIGLRVFITTEGHRAVLVDAPAPALINDPRLAKRGILEIPTWVVAVDVPGADAVVEIPPALDGLDWDAARLTPPADARHTTRWRLAGLVALEADSTPTPAALLARFARHHEAAAWFDTTRRLVDDGRVVVARTSSDARSMIENLTSGPS